MRQIGERWPRGAVGIVERQAGVERVGPAHSVADDIA
jgi:hypothetical protein